MWRSSGRPFARLRRSPPSTTKASPASHGACRQPLDHRRRQIQGSHGVGGAAGIEDPDDGVLAIVAGDHRYPEIHRHDPAIGLHPGAKAPILRPAPFGDVQGGEDLDARQDFYPLAAQVVGKGTEVEMLQHAVDAKAHLQPGVDRLEMNVGGAAVDGDP
jgi:hypothetical protein